jgi:xanthine dehydrogenase accessory factor
VCSRQRIEIEHQLAAISRAPGCLRAGPPSRSVRAMSGIDHEVLRTACAWRAAGHRVTLGTVVRTWGSAPRPPGSLMIIRDDGQIAGSVSGGCIEDDLIDRLRRGELASNLPMVTTYGETAEEAQRFGLPCGGTVQVVLEPVSEHSALPELLAAIEGHQVIQRRLDLRTGQVRLGPAGASDRVAFDGESLQTVHGPRHRLLIIGAGQMSSYLAELAVALDFQVTVCDPRPEYREGWTLRPGITLSAQMPDDLVLAMQLDATSALVCLTHDPKLDDLALIEALRTPAFYIAAIGSRRNNDRRRARLLEFDLSEAQVARLRGPAGLSIGALTPPEIALAIAAEMVAVRRGVDLSGPLADWSGSISECRLPADAA